MRPDRDFIGGDVVVENAGSSTDMVNMPLTSYPMAENVEILIFTGKTKPSSRRMQTVSDIRAGRCQAE